MRVLNRTLLASALLPAALVAQGTAADYERAAQLNTRFQGLVTGVAENPQWIGASSRFWYRVSVKGGNQFVLVDASTKAKGPAFDHAKIAEALGAVTNAKYTPITLPFNAITFVDGEKAIEFTTGGGLYRCVLADNSCKRTGDAPAGAGGRGGRGGAPLPWYEDTTEVAPFEGPWPDDAAPSVLPQLQQQGGRGGGPNGRSPDGKWDAFVQDFNIFLRPASGVVAAPVQPAGDPAGGRGGRGGGGGGGRGGRAGGAGGGRGADAPAQSTPTDPPIRLTRDGHDKAAYSLGSIRWSPDTRHIVAYRTTPGTQRYVRYVRSSPADSLQPGFDSSALYRKPGDEVNFSQPVLLDVESRKQVFVDNALFPNAYNLGQAQWRADGRSFTFEYNQRGHQVYRVIEVDGSTGVARTIVDEQSPSFFYYNAATPNLNDAGKRYRLDIADGKEIIWMSERDGWNHLYLYDGTTGRVKNQITKGEWVVRYVANVDTVARQIVFLAGGMNARQDPYFSHYYRINFDGTGLTPLTDGDGTHTLTWSADRKFYVDSWSRVDLAPVSQLRAANGTAVMDLERGDLTGLEKAGWSKPEPFVAKGRDGKTDIWGVIYRPTNFNPKKKYPVIEDIYAGPQGSFVAKPFSVNSARRNLAELGFIVVQVDGMGTSNRSRAFHATAFKDLGDAGFPDRILWHKAIAAKYPWYDITRVGIYGTSAGGQNAMGALLFHPEFYKVAFSAAGCHDNRMDKIWWNEQWMSWPIGPQYVASSNMENAAKLQGKLMLVVGEHDTNVDPSSTMQVVNALIRANKTFDLLVIPNADHTSGGPYGERKRNDFFVHHLLGVEPPNRNAEVPGR